jgi:hypothetical protein
MDARGAPWHGGPDQQLPMEVLRVLARDEVRRITRMSNHSRRMPLCSALYGFWRWCLLSRHIKDGHDITPALVKEFRVMLRRAGVKRRVWELHRDATTIVLEVIAANKGVWHADPGDDILYLPIGGEIWEHPEREFG